MIPLKSGGQNGEGEEGKFRHVRGRWSLLPQTMLSLLIVCSVSTSCAYTIDVCDGFSCGCDSVCVLNVDAADYTYGLTVSSTSEFICYSCVMNDTDFDSCQGTAPIANHLPERGHLVS